MKQLLLLAPAVLSSTGADALVAVPGNVQLYGQQRLLEPLVPQFRRCGAKKITFHRNGVRSALYVDQNPKDAVMFACVKRVARNVRWHVQLKIGNYGQHEI